MLVNFQAEVYLCIPNRLISIGKMKKDIHPNYRPVVFKDISTDYEFITRSTVRTSDTIVKDGVEYPLVKVEISSQSHPFYTGKQKLVDTAGRVDKFYSRYGGKKKDESDE